MSFHQNYESSEPRSDAINSDKLQFVKIGATFSVASVGAFGLYFVPHHLLSLYYLLSLDDDIKSSYEEFTSYAGIAMSVAFILQTIATIFCTLVPRRSGAKGIIDVSVISLIAFLCILIQLLIIKGSGQFTEFGRENGMMALLAYVLLITHYVTYSLFFNNLSRSFGDHNGTALAKKMLVAFLVLLIGGIIAGMVYGTAIKNIPFHAKSREDAITSLKVYSGLFYCSLLGMEIFAAATVVQNVSNLNDTIARRLGRR